MHRLHLVAALACAAVLLAVPFARASGVGLVVSQVYAGGGNSGATYANDFVELFNRSGSPLDLTGWTLQYAAATSSSWQATPLGGTVQPGQYYLVQLASAAAVGAALPAPDASGTSNLATAGGKVALVHDATPLSCGAAAGDCAGVTSIEDLVGWGSATAYEGSGAAPSLSATTAALRGGGGCGDTDDNAADFTTAAPAPRTSATAAAACSATGGTTADAAVDVDVQPLLSVALERSSVSFGAAVPGQTPAPVSEHVTVVSNDAAGYSITVHRSAFTPADLPLGVAASPGAALAAIPVSPAPDLLLGSGNATTSSTGDVWASSIGFASPLSTLPAGHYAATVTFTVIGR